MCSYRNAGLELLAENQMVVTGLGETVRALDDIVQHEKNSVVCVFGIGPQMYEAAEREKGGKDVGYSLFSKLHEIFPSPGPGEPIWLTMLEPIPLTKEQTELRVNQLGKDLVWYQMLKTKIEFYAGSAGFSILYLPQALLDEEGYLNQDYAATDGVHLTAEGYKLLADHILA